jgi:hypothetical protein
MRRLKQLEGENAKLKKIVADCRWIARCFRTSFAENCKACSQARTGDGGL